MHAARGGIDQLRQRVAAALGQIIVISANKNIYPDEIVPYLQILSRNAFGNYRTLLDEIRADGMQVLKQRTSLTPLRKLWLAWKVQALGRF